jgi:hypothetical protein
VKVAVDIVAWLLALVLIGALLIPIGVAVREPMREWRQGHRKDALLIALAVGCGLFLLFALSQIVP